MKNKSLVYFHRKIEIKSLTFSENSEKIIFTLWNFQQFIWKSWQINSKKIIKQKKNFFTAQFFIFC